MATVIAPLTNISSAAGAESATMPAVQEPLIKTEYWAKPIPTRAFDWQAWVDDTADEDMLQGFGATEAAAIEDLKFQLGELVECGNCGARVVPEDVKEHENREPGYYAIEEYCSQCDPRTRAAEREAMAEAAYWGTGEAF